MDHAKLRSENMQVNRLHVLSILRVYRDGMSAELAAIDLLEIRHQFLLPFISAECWQEEGSYVTLSIRIVRIATMLMGEEWVENYMKKQKNGK